MNTKGACVGDSWRSFPYEGLKPSKHLSSAIMDTLPQAASRLTPTMESLHMMMPLPCPLRLDYLVIQLYVTIADTGYEGWYTVSVQQHYLLPLSQKGSDIF